MINSRSPCTQQVQAKDWHWLQEMLLWSGEQFTEWYDYWITGTYKEQNRYCSVCGLVCEVFIFLYGTFIPSVFSYFSSPFHLFI